MNHIIKQQLIEARISDQKLASEIQQELSYVYKRHVIPSLNHLFDELDNHEIFTCIDQIEVYVGQIHHANLRDEFPKKVKEAIAEELRKVVNASTSTSPLAPSVHPEQPTQKSKEEMLLEAFAYYLKFGTYPWNREKQASKSFQDIFEQLNKEAPSLLRQLLLQELKKDDQIKRVVFQMDGSAKNKLLKLLVQNNSSDYLVLITDLENIVFQNNTNLSNTHFSQKKTIQNIWIKLIKWGLKEGFQQATDPKTIHHLLEAIACIWFPGEAQKTSIYAPPKDIAIKTPLRSIFSEIQKSFTKGYQVQSFMLKIWLMSYEQEIKAAQRNQKTPIQKDRHSDNSNEDLDNFNGVGKNDLIETPVQDQGINQSVSEGSIATSGEGMNTSNEVQKADPVKEEREAPIKVADTSIEAKVASDEVADGSANYETDSSEEKAKTSRETSDTTSITTEILNKASEDIIENSGNRNDISDTSDQITSMSDQKQSNSDEFSNFSEVDSDVRDEVTEPISKGKELDKKDLLRGELPNKKQVGSELNPEAESKIDQYNEGSTENADQSAIKQVKEDALEDIRSYGNPSKIKKSVEAVGDTSKDQSKDEKSSSTVDDHEETKMENTSQKVLPTRQQTNPTMDPNHRLKAKRKSEDIPIFHHPNMLEEAFIDNAGLVLLWPYFTTLFRGMHWMEGDMFHSEEEQYKAIHFLQYLVVADKDYDESSLTLNKLLCGLKAEEPVPERMIFSKEEQDEAENLLTVVIQNWSVLKGTSIDGFRQTFLKKEGILKKDFNGWKLYVERSTIDILLERIPWGYSIIKLPWLEQMIYVEW